MVRKRDAAQAILDAWRNRPLRLGTNDCVRMIAAHLRKLGRKVKLPPSGSYRTVASATKALKAAGFASVGEALDALGLERIAPAAAVAGDIIQMPAVDSLGAFAIALGNGRVVAYHEAIGGGVQVLQPLEYVAAWRVMPV
ncbi:DUF6950 family protein [Sphingomonas sp. S2-65]|uniref:DUF6950 family protein n=1 Tax=Sphingomonas sp. S2-65 TaxID=2903960 RepID=UPI001F1D7A2D|nr:hypothetical protein [Sphingomonas sp. S2-65]UYY60100.1 hypothetical protein LZ586_08490 [Sphingomonas sp. S2-65]